jgi:(p)ppGpp synthase/HD superfamily hydrolase
MNIIEKSKTYGTQCHRQASHYYDAKPYEVHLQMVYDIANEFIYLVPENDRDNVLAACWVHDTIEDCRQTYNDVKAHTNETVAELAYAVTNEKGKTRKERANDKYFTGIRNTPNATFLKLCDRIANYEYSKQNNSSATPMYEKEMENFIEQLYDEKYEEMFARLRKKD